MIADQLQQVGGATDLLIATGNVEIIRGATRLLADRVELNRDTGQAVAQGKVVFYDGPDRLVGERIDYNLKTGTGVVYKGSAVSAPYYHLSAERMDRVGDSVYEMRRGVFTTCEGDDPPWSFRFGSGTADLDDIVYGRDASFWVKGVPVLPWVPFFAAALRRERQSGFLFPEFGQSSRKGFFSRVPYFWAIDDSQDLTVSLDGYSRRGVGIEADYRYVLSREQRGELAVFGVNEFAARRSHGCPRIAAGRRSATTGRSPRACRSRSTRTWPATTSSSATTATGWRTGPTSGRRRTSSSPRTGTRGASSAT